MHKHIFIFLFIAFPFWATAPSFAQTPPPSFEGKLSFKTEFKSRVDKANEVEIDFALHVGSEWIYLLSKNENGEQTDIYYNKLQQSYFVILNIEKERFAIQYKPDDIKASFAEGANYTWKRKKKQKIIEGLPCFLVQINVPASEDTKKHTEEIWCTEAVNCPNIHLHRYYHVPFFVVEAEGKTNNVTFETDLKSLERKSIIAAELNIPTQREIISSEEFNEIVRSLEPEDQSEQEE